MSGHNKWSTIKRKKGALDAKRGALFTKLIREITVAARLGGEDIEANPRLRTAVLKARAANMPNDNIERAIKKGTGNIEGVVYEEVRYEGYGPGGVAIMIDCITDNKNRTTPEIRTIFSKNGGNLGETGSVSYLFDKKGMIIIEGGKVTEDEVIEMLLDFDVEDIKTEDGNIVITTSPEGYNSVSDFLVKKDFNLLMNQLTYVPKTTVTLDEKKAQQCLRIIELLEDQDDTQEVYSNYDIPDEIMAKISEQ
ncbi:MAG: putative transcriptional regulatory protein [Spirochaetes bacterium ADurb.Bin218]|jgi:YebC/PmpR family DNA-binding regulatory protein|nr:YebC/PmpR family DNA-binding transcriptional regulator [Spirochaetota bacterium]OQA96051.1 MAG: putative transcriptional regulatory protein [Spirochaetes bacterium ADurb.Bin218]HOQ11271.1 YebC/PmpR family DNA-binding transcriptional regulator [Spirochaetota bacterium]HOV07559.1 YebC/PmpR family DNA-binding transcriptional regulator [Spirochaetota bacterium]HPX90751.1 YebC/PmpR family DNA-binding transcriptional regulator [Spirochaetota bacterium]